eukprot:tig00020563_g11313.t1
MLDRYLRTRRRGPLGAQRADSTARRAMLQRALNAALGDGAGSPGAGVSPVTRRAHGDPRAGGLPRATVTPAVPRGRPRPRRFRIPSRSVVSPPPPASGSAAGAPERAGFALRGPAFCPVGLLSACGERRVSADRGGKPRRGRRSTRGQAHPLQKRVAAPPRRPAPRAPVEAVPLRAASPSMSASQPTHESMHPAARRNVHKRARLLPIVHGD